MSCEKIRSVCKYVEVTFFVMSQVTIEVHSIKCKYMYIYATKHEDFEIEAEK